MTELKKANIQLFAFQAVSKKESQAITGAVL
jgi:hypothetical protein